MTDELKNNEKRLAVTVALAEVYLNAADNENFLVADRARFAAAKYVTGSQGITITDPSTFRLPSAVF